MTREEAMEKIFTVNLGVARGQRVLVLTDTIGEDEDISKEEREKREALRVTAKLIAEAGRRHASTTFLEFPATGVGGAEPPEVAWKAAFGGLIAYRLMEIGILDPIIAKVTHEKMLTAAAEIMRECIDDGSKRAFDVVVALTYFSTTHTMFRRYLTDVVGARYASCPGFEAVMLDGVMQADVAEIEERTIKLTDLLNGSEEVHITTEEGTDIRFSVKGRAFKADTGNITAEGSYSNLPAGETFVAPIEGTAEGKLVLMWAPTRKLDSPVTIFVKDGRAINVEGTDPYASELQKVITRDPLFGNIAELGIGTNDRATRPDNILEGEKILGTLHIALGDNSTFGGKVSVPFHQDFIFFEPTMTVTKDGLEKTVIDKGTHVL